ncbi:unnamed protein product [Amoebophrya sp. A120]|nr:unnamed protein product [Amoebophrya sp. A120]|eukprot:GSA120T00009288001.1
MTANDLAHAGHPSKFAASRPSRAAPGAISARLLPLVPPLRLPQRINSLRVT